MEKSPRPDKVLDARGLTCPEPVLRTAAEVGGMAEGEVLEVIADDPASEEDVRSWARRTENELLKVWKTGKDFHFLIRKTS
ncbi:sulfurtransferase TusA family protein [Candidatus Hecatella orcuttiae]|uniref:sulfurtransferase TusA family protein n=1 Tax=Candidatus Hecatella orcuttiae TaxID=1935119 RepID=UPI00286800E0|nr:sulfurtransferase TusA family protein [Candidatus Hecatella orcuttiae]